jgi:hypothetical protein
MFWGILDLKPNRLTSNTKTVIIFNKLYISVYWISSSLLYTYAPTSIVYERNMNIVIVCLFILRYKVFS